MDPVSGQRCWLYCKHVGDPKASAIQPTSTWRYRAERVSTDKQVVRDFMVRRFTYTARIGYIWHISFGCHSRRPHQTAKCRQNLTNLEFIIVPFGPQVVGGTFEGFLILMARLGDVCANEDYF